MEKVECIRAALSRSIGRIFWVPKPRATLRLPWAELWNPFRLHESIWRAGGEHSRAAQRTGGFSEDTVNDPENYGDAWLTSRRMKRRGPLSGGAWMET